MRKFMKKGQFPVWKAALVTALFTSLPAAAQDNLGLIGTDTLLGRDTAGTGQIESITVGTGLSFDGTKDIDFTSTEIGTTTWGSGSGIVWTFDAGATDPVLTFGSNSLAVTNAIVNSITGLVITHTAQLATHSGPQTPALQVLGTTHDASSIGLMRFSGANAFAPVIHIGKSRGASVGSYSIVSNSDQLGHVSFAGDNGSTMLAGAEVSGLVDSIGTPSATSMPGQLQFKTTADGSTSATARWRINSEGRLTGPLASAAQATLDGAQNNALQLLGTSHDDSSIAMMRFTNNAFAPVLGLAKSRGASVGTYTVVQDGDQLGFVTFQASDGTDMENTAQIGGYVDDGTPAADDIGGMIRFGTADGNGTGMIQRWRIGSDGRLTGPTAHAGETVFGSGATNPALQVLGTGTADSSIVSGRYSNDVNASVFFFAKSRGVAIGTETIVSTGDTLGIITWSGADQSNSFAEAVKMRAEVDGTPGAGSDMPGRFILSVSADGSETPTDWLVLKNDGALLIGDNDAGITGAGLHIDDQYDLFFHEDDANGDNYVRMEAAASVTSNQTCTFLNQATFIPYGCLGSSQPTITVDTATTFAITTSQIDLQCTGAETINTITGGSTGMRLLILHHDTECTIADDDDPTAADAINLTGAATNDVGAVDKVIELIYNGVHWLQVSESANG